MLVLLAYVSITLAYEICGKIKVLKTKGTGDTLSCVNNTSVKLFQTDSEPSNHFPER